MFAWIFDECREGQIPRCSAAQQAWYPVACSGVFDFGGAFLRGNSLFCKNCTLDCKNRHGSCILRIFCVSYSQR